MKIRYFDNAATTAVRDEVLMEMLPYFSCNFGNASALYEIGKKSKKAIENSRCRVAKAINANKDEIYFTSCGSESDNLALKGILKAYRNYGNHLITTKIEHPAILNTAKSLENEGIDVTYLNVDRNGFIDLGELQRCIRPETILISIMFANNEIGTIQEIQKIGELARRNNIIFHTDAVQAIGNVKIDVQKLNIDALSMSAHKFYGPKGMGALYIRNGIEFKKIQDGGHQEKDKRAGTENVAGIVGLGKAIEIANNNIEQYCSRLYNLRQYFLKLVKEQIPNVRINGDLERRLPGNANIRIEGIKSKELLPLLDTDGICVSVGSACSSGNINPSHVLLAIGLSKEEAESSIRVTFGRENTKEDVEFLVEKLKKAVEFLRRKNGSSF